MWVAREAFAVYFLAEVEQLLFSQPSFQISACINTWGHVALDVDAITPVVFALSMPKMVKACAKHVGQRGEGANMTAEVTTVFGVVAVSFDHHRHCVPTHIGT